MYRKMHFAISVFVCLFVFLFSVYFLQNSSDSRSLFTAFAFSLAFFLSSSSFFYFSRYIGRIDFTFIFSILLFFFLFVCFLCWLAVVPIHYEAMIAFFFCSFLFFCFLTYTLSHFIVFSVGYVDFGRVKRLPEIVGIKWKRLENPEINIHELKGHVIMADLRADLPAAWEVFLAKCSLAGLPVYHSSRLIESVSGRVKVDHLYENNLGSLLPSKTYVFVKRLLDTFLIFLSLPLVLPVCLITAIVIPMESKGGVFFVQDRVGRGGEPFKVFKFRSMCASSESGGAQFAQKNDMRVTRVGKFIRKTRIDELPQFINVLKGDMSLIGPRPEQVKFVNQFKKEIPFYDYRHIVKPGISGWAQVVHGYAADTEDTKIKLEYDFYYIKNFSFSLDLLIFFKTIQTILTGFGAR